MRGPDPSPGHGRSTQFPMRSYAFGDASQQYHGRSGKTEIGCILEVGDLPDVTVKRSLDGRVVVTVDDETLLDVVVDNDEVPCPTSP